MTNFHWLLIIRSNSSIRYGLIQKFKDAVDKLLLQFSWHGCCAINLFAGVGGWFQCGDYLDDSLWGECHWSIMTQNECPESHSTSVGRRPRLQSVDSPDPTWDSSPSTRCNDILVRAIFFKTMHTQMTLFKTWQIGQAEIRNFSRRTGVWTILIELRTSSIYADWNWSSFPCWLVNYSLGTKSSWHWYADII